jgi:putative lipoic acid-binding regulatory protein
LEPHSVYPCLFPVKVIGECSERFVADVLSVMERYAGDWSDHDIARRRSRGGKYLSLTIRFTAQSRDQLEKLYAELNAQERVILVL